MNFLLFWEFDVISRGQSPWDTYVIWRILCPVFCNWSLKKALLSLKKTCYRSHSHPVQCWKAEEVLGSSFQHCLGGGGVGGGMLGRWCSIRVWRVRECAKSANLSNFSRNSNWFRYHVGFQVPSWAFHLQSTPWSSNDFHGSPWVFF